MRSILGGVIGLTQLAEVTSTRDHGWEDSCRMAHLADTRHSKRVILGAGRNHEIVVVEVVLGPLEHLSGAQRFSPEINACKSRGGGWMGGGGSSAGAAEHIHGESGDGL